MGTVVHDGHKRHSCRRVCRARCVAVMLFPGEVNDNRDISENRIDGFRTSVHQHGMGRDPLSIPVDCEKLPRPSV